MEQIGTIIEEENLSDMIELIEKQVNEADYTAMDIAAAFLYQAMGAGESSSEKKNTTLPIPVQKREW